MEGIQIHDQLVGFNNDVVYLKIDGYIDTSTSLELVSHLKELIQKGNVQLVVDLSGVNYISSAGWGVFVGEIKEVREKGGDIKLVNMTPDVYDVFQMLEFDKILKPYESVEEAINEYDIFRGYDITATPVKVRAKKDEEKVPDIQISRGSAETTVSGEKRERIWTGKPNNPALLPMSEKIKHVVAQNPLLGVWGIKKALKSNEYGNTRISLFKLMRLLKELNLSTKEQRYRYYRSR